jgi:hypothetical protein
MRAARPLDHAVRGRRAAYSTAHVQGVRSTPWRVVLFYNRRLYDKRRVWRNVPIRTSIIDKQEHIEQAARALKSISHPLRLKILCVIGDQDACVQEIVDAVGYFAKQHFPASCHSARKGRSAGAQGCQPGLLPRWRRSHAAVDRHDARGVLRRLAGLCRCSPVLAGR